MPFKKGQVANPRGRPKGSKDKIPAELRRMTYQALSNKGGVEYLERQADENPVAFLGLVGKCFVVPKDDSTNQPQGITINVVQHFGDNPTPQLEAKAVSGTRLECERGRDQASLLGVAQASR